MNEYMIDILREMSNISSAKAVSALIDLTNLRLEMTVPSVSIIDFRDLPELFGCEDESIMALSQEITGKVKASLFIGFDENSVKLISRAINSKYDICGDIGSIYEMDDMQVSMIYEIGNIVAGSYISALSSFIDENLNLTPVDVAVNMSGAIISQLIGSMDVEGDKVLLTENKIMIDDIVINTKILMLPTKESVDFIVDCIEDKYLNEV